MRMQTNPQKLAEGKQWLFELMKPECPGFHRFAGYIFEAVERGYYTYGELGSTAVTVIERAIYHAGEEAKHGYPQHVARKNEYLCLLQKELGAHRPPEYAQVVPFKGARKRKLQEAA